MGLNEDCILGINGVNPAYAGANYMNAITGFVNRLHTHGLYAEISLMWAAPGSQQALDHPPILDADHAPAALQAIGNAFKNDPKTFIGLQSSRTGSAGPAGRTAAPPARSATPRSACRAPSMPSGRPARRTPSPP